MKFYLIIIALLFVLQGCADANSSEQFAVQEIVPQSPMVETSVSKNTRPSEEAPKPNPEASPQRLKDLTLDQIQAVKRTYSIGPRNEFEVVKITEKAAAKFKSYLDEIDTPSAIEVGIIPGGCSGFQYKLNVATKDQSIQYYFQKSHDLDIRVQFKHFRHLNGTVIDWSEKNGKQGFNFDNPNFLSTKDLLDNDKGSKVSN